MIRQTQVWAATAERWLWSITLLCAVSLLFVQLSAQTAKHFASTVSLSQVGSQPSTEGGSSFRSVRKDSAGEDESSRVIGRIEIPRLSLSVPILSDYETSSLLRGVGHIRGTAMPGGLGNLVLAGHRDTFFRPLRRIAAGMEVRVADSTGVYRYVVDGTSLVTPERVDVLAIGDRPELTLITCYPFDFIGAAPKRFIVHAHLASMLPAANEIRP